MPNPSLSDAIKEAFAVAPVTKVIYDTLEIRQATVQPSIFLVRSHQVLQAVDENGVTRTFIPVGFSITLPPETKDGFRSLSIAIDNIGGSVVQFIQKALSSQVPVEVIYRPYLSDDLSRPAMNPPLVLYLTDIQITPTQVTGRATFMDVVNRRFPSELYTRARFPGLR